MKKISILGILVESANWVLHPLANYKELQEYRKDYDKEILGFQKEKEKMQKLCKENAENCLKKTQDLQDKIEKKDKVIQDLNDKILDMEVLHEKDLDAIYKVYGKMGGTTKQMNKIKKENEELKQLINESREKLIKANEELIKANSKIEILSKKTPREKIDYTLMKRSKKNEI